MAVKRNRDLEHRIDGFYALCEKILLTNTDLRMLRS